MKDSGKQGARPRFDLAKALFFLALGIIVFAYGLAVGTYRIFPYSQLQSLKNSSLEVIQTAGMITGTKPQAHLMESVGENRGDGVVTIDRGRVAPGYTLISSFFDDGPEVRLIDLDGVVVNRWPIRFSDIWPDGGTHLAPSARPKTDWNMLSPMGLAAQNDGSLVFSELGMAKLDRCGEILWKLPMHTHHTLSRADDGGFWAQGLKEVAKRSPRRPFMPNYKIDTAIKVSPEGELVKEIVVLDVLWRNDLQGIMLANNRNLSPSPERDITHLNDVEELPAQLARRFPDFSASDLLLSLRNPNTLLVTDSAGEVVKWFQVGPWVQQHDGDWQPDGTISLFNNNFDMSHNGRYLGGSNVLRIDPATREIRNIYGADDDQPLYSISKGSHQMLENGNALIVESDQGRVLEVTPAGEVVWEFINRYSEDEVFIISEAIRYPPDFFDVADWSCP